MLPSIPIAEQLAIYARAIMNKDKKIEQLTTAIDNLEIQAVRDIITGWVSIPEIEWDSIMLSINKED